MILSSLGIAALCFYLLKFKPTSKLANTAVVFIIGGGIGNMIDRCFRVGIVDGVERHYVFDFLDFCAFPDLWKWTFNVADAFVCVGAGILLVWCIYAFVQESKAEKTKKALEAEEREENTDAVDEKTEEALDDTQDKD